jgi:hypothetical protein
MWVPSLVRMTRLWVKNSHNKKTVPIRIPLFSRKELKGLTQTSQGFPKQRFSIQFCYTKQLELTVKDMNRS